MRRNDLQPSQFDFVLKVINKAMFQHGGAAIIESLRNEHFDLLITAMFPQDEMIANILGVKNIRFIPTTSEPFIMSILGTGVHHSSQINFISSTIGDMGSYSSLTEAQLSFKMRSLNFLTNIAARVFGKHILMRIVLDMWPEEIHKYASMRNPPELVIHNAVEGVGLPMQIPMNTKFVYPKYKAQVSAEDALMSEE